MGAGMSDSLDAWFAREILVHEAPLVQYLMRTWPTKDEIHDLRQETYTRVYEAAANERPRCAKSFLFATARRLLADRMAGRRVVSFEVGRDLDDRNVLIDGISSEQPAGADEDLRSLAQALSILPTQCRQVVWMRRVEQKSQKEIAARLGISEAMVKKHIANAMRRLADALFGCQFSETPKAETVKSVSDDHDAQQLTS
jgi:RNA polymerase sigma factor (sigma-70 family)